MIQLAGFLDHSTVNGTGFRSVVFFSGCSLNCKGCHNKEMQNHQYGESVSVEDIMKRIMKNKPLLDGVTISGGDPFEQIDGLTELLVALKKEGMDTWVYTGRTKEQLEKDERNKKALSLINTLVDGPFVEEMKTTHEPYVGSANQRILKLN